MITKESRPIKAVKKQSLVNLIHLQIWGQQMGPPVPPPHTPQPCFKDLAKLAGWPQSTLWHQVGTEQKEDQSLNRSMNHSKDLSRPSSLSQLIGCLQSETHFQLSPHRLGHVAMRGELEAHKKTQYLAKVDPKVGENGNLLSP